MGENDTQYERTQVAVKMVHPVVVIVRAAIAYLSYDGRTIV